MLPAPNRLRGTRDFDRMRRAGRSFFSAHFTLRLVSNALPVSRVAFIVSTKVSKKTVERNTLKRRLREIIRVELPRVKRGYDILIIAKKSALECSFREMREEIVGLLEKARISIVKNAKL